MPAVDRLFRAQRTLLQKLAPHAEVQHVGATTLPFAQTKGDLDIQLRVQARDFHSTCRALEQHFTRNPGGFTGEHGASFEAPASNDTPSLGVHVTVKGSETDIQWALRDLMLERPDLVGEYNAIKRHYYGDGDDAYLRAKDRFFTELLSLDRFLAIKAGDPRALDVVLQTQRLELRTPDSLDAEPCARFARDNREHLQRWEPSRSEHYYSDESWSDFIQDARRTIPLRQRLWLLIRRKGETEILGMVNYGNVVRGSFNACHLGYNLGQAAEGNGYMSEALRASLSYVFEAWGLHRVMANYRPHNTRSGTVLERLGFVKEGEAKDYLHIDGAWRDHILTSLTHPDAPAPTPT